MEKKQFIVIGLGRFGQSVATTLTKLGHHVLAVDTDEAKVRDISESVTYAVQLNAMNERALLEVGARNFEVGIVSIGADIQANIFVALTLKQMGIKYVIAKAQNQKHAEILRKIGVDKVILPEQDMGQRLAYNLSSTSIIDMIELSPEYNVVEVKAPKIWVNKSLLELNLRAQHKINVLAIKSDSENIKINPSGEDIIQNNDILVIIGEKIDLNKMINSFK